MKSRSAVAVIGGGIVGASVAYNLAAAGVDDIVILEKSRVGSGSTVASLGGFRAQFSNALSIKLSQRSIKIIGGFQELTGYDPLMRRDGYVFLASTEASLQRLGRDRDLERSMGVAVESLEGDELQERFPFYRFDSMLGGNLCMEDGHASTMAVHQGYVTLAKRMGVEVNEGVEVKAAEQVHGRGYALRTSGGTIESDSVVIAAGAYSGVVGSLASVEIPIAPYPRKVLVTNSFSDGIPENIPLLIDVDSTFAFGREGRGLLFGTNPTVPSSFELAFPPGYEDDVMRMTLERVPSAKGCTLSRTIMGLYEMTPDANPIVCEIPGKDRLYCCAGFAGHGFMHAPAIGEVFAELFVGKKTSVDISSLDIGRFASQSGDRERLIV